MPERIFKISLRVRYAETDQMGVVYYANYLVWFEVARTELFRELGMYYSEVEKEGIILPAVESHLKYIASAYYDEDIEIYTKITELKGASITFTYEAVRPSDKKILTKGFTRHAFLTKNERKIIPIPEDIRKLLEPVIAKS